MVENRPAPAKAASVPEAMSLALFLLTTVLVVNGVKLGVGPVPFRSLTLLGSGFFALLAAPADAAAVARRLRIPALVIAFAALCIVMASLLSGTGAGRILEQLAQLHVQAMISLLVAALLARRFGHRRVAAAIVAAYAVTATVAMAQALGIEAAWNLRALIGGWSGDDALTAKAYLTRERAMGLSFSPVIFASQSMVTLALLLFPHLLGDGARRQFRWQVPALCALFAVLAIATGNRSPLLGIGIFLLSYLCLTRARAAAVVVPLLALAAVLAAPLASSIEDSGLRAVKTDSSSENRAVLRAFGFHLIAERPLGYGVAFDSTAHAEGYYDDVIYEANPQSIRRWALHNFYLMVIAKHGLLVLLVLFALWPRGRFQWRLAWAFLPYAVHIFYHNDGPLQGAIDFFFVLPLGMLLADAAKQTAIGDAPRRQKWRRAFAPA